MNEATQNGAARRRRCNATEGGALDADAVLLRMLGSELEAAEASLPLPAPPRVPTLIPGAERLLYLPPTGLPPATTTVPPPVRRRA